ncbi:MAG: cbb3-type cytochrome c oxidase N-terminal domain-containing protein [Bacteroidota bacterium]
MSNTDDKNLHHGEPEIDELTNDRYLGGHEYDGIRELDNKLPQWWLYLFYVTIIFALVYLVGYHLGEWWPLQEKEYTNEVAAMEEIKKANPEVTIDLENMVPLTTEVDLAAGKETYDKICVTCHGKFGEGLVGPNMTDMFWIHGDSINNKVTIRNLYDVVITGVISKGMISYKDQLSPIQIQQVLSFILTFQGTNPANQKPAQGRKYDAFG